MVGIGGKWWASEEASGGCQNRMEGSRRKRWGAWGTLKPNGGWVAEASGGGQKLVVSARGKWWAANTSGSGGRQREMVGVEVSGHH